jgi:hypothetical protein
MGFAIVGWILLALVCITCAGLHLRVKRIDNELNEHTKQRHKHYRKREKATRDLMDDTPINEIKVGGTD